MLPAVIPISRIITHDRRPWRPFPSETARNANDGFTGRPAGDVPRLPGGAVILQGSDRKLRARRSPLRLRPAGIATGAVAGGLNPSRTSSTSCPGGWRTTCRSRVLNAGGPPVWTPLARNVSMKSRMLSRWPMVSVE